MEALAALLAQPMAFLGCAILVVGIVWLGIEISNDLGDGRLRAIATIVGGALVVAAAIYSICLIRIKYFLEFYHHRN